MSFWSKFFIALAITILATTGAVVGVFAGQKEQIDMGGSIKYTVPYFTVTFLNYDDTVFETQQVAYGHDAVAPANNPTRPGHTFNGWTDYTNITQDRSVTANWIKNEAYLTTGAKWQAIVNASPVGSQANIEQIEFVSSVPSGATLIGSVGVTNETATTVWTEGCGVFDVKAYYTALSTGKYKILFYSPYTIYAPKDSNYLFSNSTSANRLTNLTSISFVNFNTSKVTNMYSMFWYCSKLTSLNVSNFDTSKVTTMYYMFYYCSKLTSLDLSNFNTSNVTNMTSMFGGCSSLTSLNVSNFNTSNATSMRGMFSHCSSLTSLNLSNFNTSNVSDMASIFIGCSSLTSLNLSSFNTSNIAGTEYMFYDCSKLTSLNLSSFDMTKVTNTDRMLDTCSALTEIKTPKAIGREAVNLPIKYNYSWFDQANANNVYTQITSACLSKTLVFHENYSYLQQNWQTALTNNNANFKQENIKTIQFVNTVPSNSSSYTQVSVGATTSAGTTAFVAGTAGVSDIIAYVKANSSDSTKYDVIFYSPVTIYAPVDSSYLFSNSTTANQLKNLTSISFGNFNTSKVTNMSEMFWNCSSLTSLNLSNFNTSNVTNMSYMFTWCFSLTSLNVSNFNTSKVTDMKWMFSDCRGLTSLNVSNFNTSNVTHMSYMFYNCSSLTSLNLSNFYTSKVTSMTQMFYNCSSLTSLNLSNFNTSNVTNMPGMFENCSKLTSLNLSSFDMSKVTSSDDMFSGCTSLTTIYIPKSIKSGTSIALPTKTGYSWVDQANTNNAYTQITSACTNKTLVLRINTYTLSIDPNGGYRVSDNSTAVITVTKEYNSGESISERRKSGYTLTGYTLKNTATGSTTDVGGATFSFNSSTKTGVFTQGTVACTLVAEWTANTYAETFLNSYIPIGTGEYNNGGTWTVSNGEYSFKTLSTTSNGGPYLTNLYSFMSNGEKYRIYFTAKATTAISLTATFEAGGSKAISLTTSYQEFFVDVTYNASSTYKALTFYSTGWTGQTLSIKNIKVAKIATFNSTYGTLPTPTRTGYTFNGWSKNFFNPTLTYGYTSTCTRNGEIFTFDTGSQNSSSLFFEIQSWDNTSYIQGIFSATSTGVHSFVFTKNSSITQLRFKYNGNKIDSCFYYDVSSLPDGSYVIQVNITTMQMNKIVVKDIMIEQNANNSKTSYVSSTNYVLASSTVNEPFNRTLFASWTLNESYLRKDWQTALTNNNANFKQANIKTIQFVNTIPSGSGYTQVSVGATTSAGTTAFVSGTAGVSDIIAYVKANSSNSTKYDVIFYSPVTIYAPVNSRHLFSNSTYANRLTNLTSISFGNFNTSKVTSMDSMFCDCYNLTSLDLSSFDTSKVTHMGYMFNNCSSLTSLNVSNFNTSNVTYMFQMFYSCSSLTSLNVSNFNTSNVTIMSSMFLSCSKLTSLNLSNFDTSKVTHMSRMFEGCSSLTSLNVSSFNTSNVTDMTNMFNGCSKLTSLNVSSFNTSKVTDMGYMFYNCESLNQLSLSNFDTSKVTNMSSMFSGCSKLTSLNVSSFDTSKVTNMERMFFTCPSLSSLNLSSFDMSNVTKTSHMFYDCTSLTTIYTPKTMGSTTVSLPGTSDGLHAWYKSTDSNRNTPYTTISSSNTNSTLNLRVIMRTITITWGSDSNGNGNWSFDVQWNGSVQVSSSQGGTQSGTRTFRVEATTSIQCSFWIQSPPGLIWHKTGSVSISGTCTNSNFGSNTAPTAKGEAHRTANASNFKSDITISFYFSAKK